MHREIEVVTELSRKAIYDNAHMIVDQDEWQERNNGYLERHRKSLESLAQLEDMKRERHSKSIVLEAFIQSLASSTITLEEFDNRLWMAAISKVTVQKDGNLLFDFKDGTSNMKSNK